MLGWTKAVRRPLWLAVSGDAEQAHCRWRPARRAREPHCDCVTAPGVSRPAQTGHRTVGEQLQGEPEARVLEGSVGLRRATKEGWRQP